MAKNKKTLDANNLLNNKKVKSIKNIIIETITMLLLIAIFIMLIMWIISDDTLLYNSANQDNNIFSQVIFLIFSE